MLETIFNATFYALAAVVLGGITLLALMAPLALLGL